jgi:hypothetical protein
MMRTATAVQDERAPGIAAARAEGLSKAYSAGEARGLALDHGDGGPISGRCPVGRRWAPAGGRE